MAVTSLALHGLIENKELDPNYDSSISLAKDYLLSNLTSLREQAQWPSTIFGPMHSEFMHWLSFTNPSTVQVKEKIKSTIRQQIFMLQKYESVDGGWGYYDFNVQTKQPSGSSISLLMPPFSLQSEKLIILGFKSEGIIDRAKGHSKTKISRP